MNIIGLTGHTERGHDGSVALIQNGKITFLAEEERFTRVRHAYDSYPINALKKCLEFANLKISDIDFFATGWNYETLYSVHKRNWNKKEYLGFLNITDESKIKLVDHHTAHAASAFFTSGMTDALILIIDGQGEVNSTSIFVGKNKNLEAVYESPASFGYYFSAVTKQCGFKVGEEGKTMGLVPYGKVEQKILETLKKHIYFDESKGELVQNFFVQQEEFLDEQDKTIEQWKMIFDNIIPQKQERITDLKESDFQYANFARTCQEYMQNVVLKMVDYYCKKFEKRNVCVAGGVGLSCKMNARILEDLDVVDNIYIQPAANDGGVSLGAALFVANQFEENVHQEMNPYLGTSYTDEEIEAAIIESGLRYKRSSQIELESATLLAQDKILAIFQGRFEFGPRALGNRTILANPHKLETWYVLNKLKGRELWRPLAPILREENVKDLFKTDKMSPFMTITFEATDFAKQNVPAVIHVDDSARMQTVSLKQNQFIYNVLEKFEELTGIKALINTSFNKRGEPIIESPKNAIKSFLEMGLDNLFIGPFIVYKD